MAGYIFSANFVDQLRRTPIHEVLRDLGTSGRDAHLLATKEFRKLIGYLMEIADGRDRREPMTEVPGTHRPYPRLRVLLGNSFGDLGDLTWFRLNKIAGSGKGPLTGTFPRMAASVGRLETEDLAELVAALVHETPDKKLLKLLNDRGGKIKKCGLELFTRLAHLFRPDLYFVIPKTWGEDSGCFKFINNDLRKYCALCRSLRQICDEVGFPQDVRSALFTKAVEMDPIHPSLESALAQSVGSALAWANILDSNEGYVASIAQNDEITVPLEVASAAIRLRRGETKLRSQLCSAYGNKCAISGDCPKDLLEAAYIAPYPAGNVHSIRNTLPLRSDLHTLWDLNQIAVDPKTLEVQIGIQLRGSYYESFSGTKLDTTREGARIDIQALQERWQQFRSAQKKLASAPKKRGTVSKSASSLDNVEIQTFSELEPQKSSASGIWKSPQHSGSSGAYRAISAESEG